MTGLPLWFIERQQARAEEERATRRVLSPNDRPRLALIGCGGMGRADGQIATEFGDIVAVCDVDDDHRVVAVEQFTLDGRAPAAYADFRKLLERDDVDGIINVTPDHWHTLINIGAARAGKDIYSEKPLTLTVDEGRHVIRAVRENNVILQTGTQQRSNHRFRLACELVRNGRLGQLQRANVWLPAGLREGPFSTARVPAGLNWDFWQGPAPAMEYVPERCHTKFRYWYEYSGGTMTDWGAHHNDIAYWAVGLIAPRDVIARPLSEPVPGGYTAFADYEVHYRYDNGVELNIQTTRDDNIYGEKTTKQGQHNGIRFEGTNGWIWVSRHEIIASDPELLAAPLPDDAERLYHSDSHMGNFVECMRTRELPICDVEVGHRSANMCHLGAISMRTGLKLTWDYEQERFVGDGAAEANKFLSREMRKPYDYSFVS